MKKTLTFEERTEIINKVKNSRLTGLKALEYAEQLSIESIEKRGVF